VICKFVTSLLLFYYYKLVFWCLRDEQDVDKQRSVDVKPKAHHVCHNRYIAFDVINLFIKSAFPL
jgi:hypothetical protein